MPNAPHRAPTVLMTADTVGGVWTYALALCAALPRFRFVLASLGPRAEPAQRDALARLGNTVLEEADWRLEWAAGAGPDLAPARRWLAGLARRHAVDLVHVNGYAHARLDCGRPVLVVAHSDVLSWWEAVHRQPAPPEWDGYRREFAAGLAAADRIVAPSAAVLADLARQADGLGGRSGVIANGIDLARFAARPKRPVVMAAGRIWDEAKNLAALDAVASELPWPVEIAGPANHPERGAVAFAAARALGRLAPEEVTRRLGEAAIFAAPSRYEPFGLAILEAAASGCALVLGDIPSLRENWEGAALFVPPEDRAALRAALLRLIGDEGERRRRAAAATTRARRFGVERTAMAYAELYGELLAAPAERERA